jgi:hypothetical protein
MKRESCASGATMLSGLQLLRLQREQHQHDKRNHFDILCLSKQDRLKHYGLHFAKYVGRLARGREETKSVERTLVDALLVSLSAANVLHQNLADSLPANPVLGLQVDAIYTLADAAGRFADGCEKIDHMEEYLPTVRKANVDILCWVLSYAAERDFDLEFSLQTRRKELAERQFYITD